MRTVDRRRSLPGSGVFCILADNAMFFTAKHPVTEWRALWSVA